MVKENKKTKEEKQQDKIEKLKARGYDVMALIQNYQQKIEAGKQELNQIGIQVAKLQSEPKKET